MTMMKLTIGMLLLCINFQTFCTNAMPTSFNKSLHKRMDPVLLKHIFHIESYDKVPEYSVIWLRDSSKPGTIDKDEMKIFHLSAFGKDIHLHLHRNKDFDRKLRTIKMFTAESTNNGIQYTEAQVEDDEPGTTYQDVNMMAAVTIFHGLNGEIQMEGTIGNDLVVKPVSKHLLMPKGRYLQEVISLDKEGKINKILDANSSITFDESPDEAKGVPHLVFKRPMKLRKAYRDTLSFEDLFGNISNSVNYGHRNKRSSSPENVWPEVLLMVDYENYADQISYYRSEMQIRRYYTIFLNAVDLRFKVFSNPKINLMLAGIIFSKDRNATSYLENNRLASPDDHVFNADAALKDLSYFLYSAENLPEYDLAILLTGLDMCTEDEDDCNRNTAGFAYYRGACLVDESEGRAMKVGIVEDYGGFDGIILAAHEIAHLLGSVHDGDSLPHDHEGPGAEDCDVQDGFIMSYRANAERVFQWSKCSLEQIKYFLSSENASCLYNEPSSNEVMENTLPGAVLSLDEQCRRNFAKGACATDGRVCIQLHCLYDDGECVAMLPAAEGSDCGGGQMCKDGICVHNQVINFTFVH